MTSKLTREQLHERARENVKALKMASRQHAFESAREEILADLQLAELALAAMDSEPVAWTWHYREQWHVTNDEGRARDLAWDGVKVEPLYRHAQPATECEHLAIENFRSAMEGIGHIRRTLEETFGGLHGTHVEPDVLAECKAICDAIYAAYGHAQPAPVVPDERAAFNAWNNEDNLPIAGVSAKNAAWLAWQARAELAGNSPALSPSREHFISLCNEFWGWSDMDMICADDKGYEPRLEWNGQSFTHPVTRGLWRMYQATPGSSPVIPDGYVMVPKEPTEAMMLHKSGCQHHAWDDPDCAMRQTCRLIWSHMLAAAPQLPGSEPATVPDRWIPVSERMPDDDDFVYIWPRPDFGVELHVGQYCECSPKGDGWYAQVY